jgi:anti-sigma regulatory factor (Ser/Thr protein kinase)
MEIVRSSTVRMLHSSLVAEVRRIVANHAADFGWDEASIGTASLIATEMATNLVKHARDGTLIVNSRTGNDVGQLQIVSIDRGPGISDVSQCLKDGYSTAGSPGTGFGAVKRLSNTFDVLSTPGKGTIVLADYAPAQTPPVQAGQFEVGAFAVARDGERDCGDAWAVRNGAGSLTVMVCDGLGHGSAAADAARAAVDAFRASVTLEPKALLELAHDALKPTRGAALAFATIDIGARELRYCGVGNICALVVHPGGARHLVSHNGIVGHRAARIAQFSSPWDSGADLVMHSDGVSGRWRPEEWPGLWQRKPAMIASAIWRDHSRGNDDATVLVARQAR